MAELRWICKDIFIQLFCELRMRRNSFHRARYTFDQCLFLALLCGYSGDGVGVVLLVTQAKADQCSSCFNRGYFRLAVWLTR